MMVLRRETLSPSTMHGLNTAAVPCNYETCPFTPPPCSRLHPIKTPYLERLRTGQVFLGNAGVSAVKFGELVAAIGQKRSVYINKCRLSAATSGERI